ncbi:MAG: hypothetical protein V4596_11055 [Bdellovibrionota bacterium]
MKIIFVFFALILFYQNLSALPPIREEYRQGYKQTRSFFAFKEEELLKESLRDGAVDSLIPKSDETIRDLMAVGRARAPSLYPMGISMNDPQNLLRDLELLVEKLQRKTRMPDKIATSWDAGLYPNRPPTHKEEKMLALGDYYHWIGHIYEDKGDLEKAYEAFIRSQYHYSQTRLKKSRRIGALGFPLVQEHSEYHMNKIISLIKEVVWAHSNVSCRSLF